MNLGGGWRGPRMNGVKRAATVDTARQRWDLADAAAVWQDRHIFIFRLLIQVALLARPRSGDEGRKEEAATAARMETRSRVCFVIIPHY